MQRDGQGSSRDLVPLTEERAVVLRLQRGDRAAFAQLYAWYGDPIYRVILARLPQPELAEDCLRDTFRTALEKIDRFTYDERSVFFWLRRIAINKAFDTHRRTKRDAALAEAAGEEPPDQTDERPDRGLDQEETRDQVNRSMAQLNPRYAEALRLRLLEDRPREECATLLGVSMGTFDVLLHRAAKAFRKVFPP